MQKIYILVTCQLLFLHFDLSESADTTCSDSQKHFANQCFTPKPFKAVDWEWNRSNQPSDGWHAVLGNDVARLHLSEAYRGKLLSLTDNYDDLCSTYKFDDTASASEGLNGTLFGFDHTSRFTCKFSTDFPGMLLCDDVSTAPTKYHENFNFYTSYTDYKNFEIGIWCFPNGQVGWIAHSITKTLTDDEKKFIMDHVKSLGFAEDTTVTLYDEKKCSNE